MAKCGHFQAATIDGVCMTCDRETSGAGSGPLVSFAGGKDNWHNGQTTTEYMRTMKADLEHLPKDRHPEPVSGNGKNRWV